MPVFCWLRLDLVFLVGRTTSGGVFAGVCELIMILGSLRCYHFETQLGKNPLPCGC